MQNKLQIYKRRPDRIVTPKGDFAVAFYRVRNVDIDVLRDVSYNRR